METYSTLISTVSILGPLIAIVLWIKKEICKDVSEIKNSVSKHQDDDAGMWRRVATRDEIATEIKDIRDLLSKHDQVMEINHEKLRAYNAEYVKLMLENHLDAMLKIQNLEGRISSLFTKNRGKGAI